MSKTIYLELRRDDTKYVAACWEHDRIEAQSADGLRLGPDDIVAIPDPHPPHAEESHSLGDLTRALIGFRDYDLRVAFEERGQIAIGQHLYAQTLGRLIKYDGLRQADLRIVTEDEHLARLPWPLLARQGHFLISTGWTISLITSPEGLQDVELRPSPSMLVVAPQPADFPDTDRDAHVTTIGRLLGKFDPRMASPEGLKIVHTWEEFQVAAREFEFDVVYFYGHGEGTQNQSRLIFESAESGQSEERSMRDVAQVLSHSQRPIRLAYLNCCQGDAGGLLGAGKQLAAVAPCVVTNRTMATIKAAKAQATAFWEHVLLQGLDPRHAVARNYQHLGQLDLTSTHPHWFTPVIHANYDAWTAHPPQAIQQYDPHWRLKVDRVDQFGRLVVKVTDMLEERKLRAIAFLWFGEPGQGMTHFHERLETAQLQRRLNDTIVSPYRVGWPDYYADQDTTRFSPRAFEEKLLEAFGVDSLEKICAAIRGDAGIGTVLAVLNHTHAWSPEVMDPGRLQDYLEWWSEYVIPKLDDEAHFFLLGFSFQTDDAEKYEQRLAKKYDTFFKRNLATSVLQPLESLKRRDLIDFVRSHNIYVPTGRLDAFLDYIMDRTKGRYEATLVELERLIIEGYEEIITDNALSAEKEDWS